MFDKLEYVEFAYRGERGDKVICHYASGKTTMHNWSWQASQFYAKRHKAIDGLVMYIAPKFSLDYTAVIIYCFVV